MNNDSKYVINGNNHIIDANNGAGLFKFINGTVEINNLIIKNCIRSAIILENCKLTTNNVTFINNTDLNEGGSVYTYESSYSSNNDISASS